MASPSPTGLLDPEGRLGDLNRRHFYSLTTIPKLRMILRYWNDPYPPPNEEIQIDLRGQHNVGKAHVFDQATDIIRALQGRGAPIGHDDLTEAFGVGKPNPFFAQWWNRAQIITLPRLQAQYEKLQEKYKKLQEESNNNQKDRANPAAAGKLRSQQAPPPQAQQDQLIQELQQQVAERDQQIADLLQQKKTAKSSQESKPVGDEDQPPGTTRSRKRRAAKSEPIDLQAQGLEDQIAARDQQIQELQRRLEGLPEEGATVVTTTPPGTVSINVPASADIEVNSATAPELEGHLVEGRGTYKFSGSTSTRRVLVNIGLPKEG